MVQYHFIGWTKHVKQVYVSFNGKYGLRGYWCKWNKILGSKILILKIENSRIKFKHNLQIRNKVSLQTNLERNTSNFLYIFILSVNFENLLDCMFLLYISYL